MNLEQYPTPETDRHEMSVKHAHRLLLDDDCIVESDKCREIERRLAACRAFINEVHKSSSSSRLVRLAKETLTLTKP